MPSNVEDVIADIEDVKDDLRTQLRRKLAAAMRVVEADARTYIEQDADWRGHLARSLSTDVRRGPNGPEIVVSTGRSAPYAPFVEFGTGSRTEESFSGSSALNIKPEQYPPSFPYSSPDLSPGMVASIIEWVETKPVAPESDISERELGYRIAATIANKGTYAHPFMRPAWFHNELRVKQAARNAIRKATR